MSAVSGHTTVHLLRHGEVYNPQGVLYGRLPGYFLSDLGLEMADRAASALANRDIAAVISSPMERAQQTAAPIAKTHRVEIVTNSDLIEAENIFEGKRVSVGDGVLKQPKTWRHLWNPFKPSWGEPYDTVATRMSAAIESARAQAQGREAVLVSHQLPIWIARLAAENRRLWHDPRSRQCTLASVTSLTFDDEGLVAITYSEPSRDLLEMASKIAGA
ncbi:MAG: histidine phosphatase family protein [Actinomycetales bacterium]|jgi:broad specificity phosphatase PhoE|nr:histidine phosphatase family protein [Actinomycetales bacterium]|tara:strand:- start:790 stop:1440 length:651 start_codon:yes stop_codon:yes gene_type:complete